MSKVQSKTSETKKENKYSWGGRTIHLIPTSFFANFW